VLSDVEDQAVVEWGPPSPACRSGPPRAAGTDQQEAFWDELVLGRGNVVLEARAGSGKSFSCREGMARLVAAGASAGRIRYTAFNKSIADEFRAKAPPGVDVGTFHSFCFRALQMVLPDRPTIDRLKSYKLLDGVLDESSWRLDREIRKTVVKLVGAAKNAAFDPRRDQIACFGDLYDLLEAMDVETRGRDETVVAASHRLLKRSMERTDLVDFDDMIWLAWLLAAPHPPTDVFMVDEAQDLNPLQHEVLAAMAADGRMVAVGDPRQSIYLFRGADPRSMGRLTERFDARTMPLTYTFRCPKRHVELARKWVPDFHARPENDDGEIVEGGSLDALVDLAGPGDQVVCRRNAPLVKAALRLIGARKPATIRGRAFGDELTPILRRCQAATVAGLVRALDEWETSRLAALAERDGAEEARERVTDQAAATRAVALACSTPTEVSRTVADLFVDSAPADRVVLSSIHRAKGTESRRVFLIHAPTGPRRSKRPPSPAEVEQEENCQYVAHTRSLHSLVHIHV